ncbi:FecR family protein [Flammeovirga kamogawensis]|uniref:FecR domain-containing protein n=1 Tax=Flammeovirga kamogawensis TaxID=373891 RepID=A0ABX8GTH3_9BACT|nr:FecR domain-containing protein [Flammeovirga kamogawensis]MBB6463347.1 ferric-dicitrate binding protein FerR (iron transport regulator) [Flammeovirga kamogawensis]QWG06681.1 FecR domain-containing protein [Flammeovirga kamogawensis]TRX68503.1 DUF4974 domain-containing protein [Flammeovirga kamogawensis]
MDKEINIDWTLIARCLDGDNEAVETAKKIATTDTTFKGVLSEATAIWKQSNAIGQEKQHRVDVKFLDDKVGEIWQKILEVESEETSIAVSLSNQTESVEKEVVNIWNASEQLGKKQKRNVDATEMNAAMAKMLLRMNISEEEKATKEVELPKPTLKVSKPAAKTGTVERSMWSFQRSIAAAVAILLTVGLSTFYYFGSGADQITLEATNAMASVELPDGTQVWLNKNSALTYPKDFGEGDRVVSLKGDAFFEVERDEKHPFSIITSEATTTVLGTSFHLTQDQVDVVTGKVRFEDKSSGDYVVLVKDQKGYFKGGEVLKGESDELNAAKLMQSHLSFNGQTLEETIQVLSKAYHKTIVIQNEALKSRKFSGTFENKSFDVVIELMSEAVDFDYSVDENGTIIIK